MALEPITREEIFMAKAGGQNVETPEPITRKEQFLAAIAGNSGSGGGGTNSDVVHIGAEAPTDNAALWVDTDEEGVNVVTTETPITTADNGKFLRVVDGKWAAVALENAEGASF